jgi:predicted nucleotidyltransferase component of viral defense system
MKKQRPLTASKRIQIAENLHIAIVEKIVHAKIWVCENMIFHGGTSLHLAWNSPRFSEDLDFLTNRKKGSEIQKVVQRAAKQLNADSNFNFGRRISL